MNKTDNPIYSILEHAWKGGFDTVVLSTGFTPIFSKPIPQRRLDVHAKPTITTENMVEYIMSLGLPVWNTCGRVILRLSQGVARVAYEREGDRDSNRMSMVFHLRPYTEEEETYLQSGLRVSEPQITTRPTSQSDLVIDAVRWDIADTPMKQAHLRASLEELVGDLQQERSSSIPYVQSQHFEWRIGMVAKQAEIPDLIPHLLRYRDLARALEGVRPA